MHPRVHGGRRCFGPLDMACTFYGEEEEEDDDDGLSYLWSSSFEFRSQKSLQSV